MRKTAMTHLLSQIETGCNGIMKLENGKIVFEFDCGRVTVPPHPSAPPLMEDDHAVDELRNELRETKQRLAVLSERHDRLEQMLYRIQESVCIPRFINHGQACYLYNFNTRILRFNDSGCCTHANPGRNYLVYVGNADVPFGDQNPLPKLLDAIHPHIRHDLNSIVIQPRQTITSDCGVIIKFINDWMATSPNNIEITIMNSGATLAIGFIIALCEQLKCEKLSKLKITRAKISEQTELKNKIDKNTFKRIEIENLVSYV
jgi:hypothetical protein